MLRETPDERREVSLRGAHCGRLLKSKILGFGNRLLSTVYYSTVVGSGGNGGILVMSKVPIFRISKSKFLLFQNGKEYSSILLVSY